MFFWSKNTSQDVSRDTLSRWGKFTHMIDGLSHQVKESVTHLLSGTAKGAGAVIVTGTLSASPVHAESIQDSDKTTITETRPSADAPQYAVVTEGQISLEDFAQTKGWPDATGVVNMKTGDIVELGDKVGVMDPLVRFPTLEQAENAARAHKKRLEEKILKESREVRVINKGGATLRWVTNKEGENLSNIGLGQGTTLWLDDKKSPRGSMIPVVDAQWNSGYVYEKLLSWKIERENTVAPSKKILEYSATYSTDGLDLDKKTVERAFSPSNLSFRAKEYLEKTRSHDALQTLADMEELWLHVDEYMYSVSGRESGHSFIADNSATGTKLWITPEKHAKGKYQFTIETLAAFGIDTPEKRKHFLRNPLLQEQIMLKFTLGNARMLLSNNSFVHLLNKGLRLSEALTASHHMWANGVLRLVESSIRKDSLDPVSIFQKKLQKISDWMGTSTYSYVKHISNTYSGLLARKQSAPSVIVASNESFQSPSAKIITADFSSDRKQPALELVKSAPLTAPEIIQSVAPKFQKIALETTLSANESIYEPSEKIVSSGPKEYIKPVPQVEYNSDIKNVTTVMKGAIVKSGARGLIDTVVSGKILSDLITPSLRNVISGSYKNAQSYQVEAEKIVENIGARPTLSLVRTALDYKEKEAREYIRIFTTIRPYLATNLQKKIDSEHRDITDRVRDIHTHIALAKESGGFVNDIDKSLITDTVENRKTPPLKLVSGENDIVFESPNITLPTPSVAPPTSIPEKNIVAHNTEMKDPFVQKVREKQKERMDQKLAQIFSSPSIDSHTKEVLRKRFEGNVDYEKIFATSTNYHVAVLKQCINESTARTVEEQKILDRYSGINPWLNDLGQTTEEVAQECRNSKIQKEKEFKSIRVFHALLEEFQEIADAVEKNAITGRIVEINEKLKTVSQDGKKLSDIRAEKNELLLLQEKLEKQRTEIAIREAGRLRRQQRSA